MSIPLKSCECGEPIMTEDRNGGVRFRAVAIIVKGLGAVAVCKKCKHDVPIPIRMSIPDDRPRLLIQRER